MPLSQPLEIFNYLACIQLIESIHVFVPKYDLKHYDFSKKFDQQISATLAHVIRQFF